MAEEMVCDSDCLDINYAHPSYAVRMVPLANIAIVVSHILFMCFSFLHVSLAACCCLFQSPNYVIMWEVTTVSITFLFPQIHLSDLCVCVPVTYNRTGDQLPGGFQWHLSFPLTNWLHRSKVAEDCWGWKSSFPPDTEKDVLLFSWIVIMCLFWTKLRK